ncbi:TetR family transcriptional regulator [soil metagenome]
MPGKGERRRQLLIEAAGQILEEDGFEAVRHRAVAERAGVPLGSTTYYFSSRDDLVVAALRGLITAEHEAASERVRSLPRRTMSPGRAAQFLLDVLLGPERAGDESLLAYYERYLQCGRVIGLRAELQKARAVTDQLLVEALERAGRTATTTDVRRLVAIADGTIISALVEGDGSARSAAQRSLTTELRSGR